MVHRDALHASLHLGAQPQPVGQPVDASAESGLDLGKQRRGVDVGYEEVQRVPVYIPRLLVMRQHMGANLPTGEQQLMQRYR